MRRRWSFVVAAAVILSVGCSVSPYAPALDTGPHKLTANAISLLPDVGADLECESEEAAALVGSDFTVEARTAGTDWEQVAEGSFEGPPRETYIKGIHACVVSATVEVPGDRDLDRILGAETGPAVVFSRSGLGMGDLGVLVNRPPRPVP